MSPFELKRDGTRLDAHKFGCFGRRQMAICKQLRMAVLFFVLLISASLLDSLLLSLLYQTNRQSDSSVEYLIVEKDRILFSSPVRHIGSTLLPILLTHCSYFHYVNFEDGQNEFEDKNETQRMGHERLISWASHALSKGEFHNNPSKMWEEPYDEASRWMPCADKHSQTHQGHDRNQTGFIQVSANGGLNQQRIAVCNAVAVAVLLNATLVLPKFLYSSVWKDGSQFGDIYQEQHFINYFKDDLNIVRELPSHLQSLDFEAIGSQITGMDIMKESELIHFTRTVLPLLRKNGVIHFLGFGDRFGLDQLPPDLQRLRCKCNFHALKFAPRIQEIGSLLVKRIRNYDSRWTNLDRQLLGIHAPISSGKKHNTPDSPSMYLALHLRFEMDIVAYSLCDFGGGDERKKLQAYREIHFPALVALMRNNASSISPEDLRKSGKCPITPEEVALVLSAVGFSPKTYIYLAGSHIYGGKSTLLPFKRLFPNIVTKEALLSPTELAPLMNFSSQLAALDFIVCATADVFAMTDSGSQLSSLVSGYRIYHGGGHAPTLRPSKTQLAKVLSKSNKISWEDFVDQVKYMTARDQRVRRRFIDQSIYGQPRSEGCMYKIE